VVEAFRLTWYERSLTIRLVTFLVGAGAILLTIGYEFRSSNPSIVGPFAAALVAGISIWMLTSASTHVTLAVLMLYLGLADGVLKLMSHSSTTTLGRDLLLYAIVLGLIVKRAIRKQPFSSPPLTGWVVAFIAVVAVQLFNPGDVSMSHSVASMRPHLEFVPLFFLGYSVMNTRQRLRGFLLLLLVIGAANGLVGLVQFGMTPGQLASWGPGYAARINGTDGVSARNFSDSSGQAHVRPFGLGDDMGVGGAMGLLALPAAFALLSLPGRPKPKVAAGALTIGAVLAVVTSQARTDLIAAVLAILVYLVLVTSSRKALRVILGAGVGLLIIYGALTVLTANSSSHLFDRYSSIAPNKALSTAYNYRKGTFALIPTYVADYPLGAGIGKSGPSANSAGGTANYGLDAESEPTYLLLELGIPGLLVFTLFQLRVLALSARIRRIADFELRTLLAGVAGPLFAVFITGLVGISSATSPNGPYIWFTSGVLSYWLIGAKASWKRAHGADA
jgi:hypothetical protein